MFRVLLYGFDIGLPTVYFNTMRLVPEELPKFDILISDNPKENPTISIPVINQENGRIRYTICVLFAIIPICKLLFLF